MRVRKIEMLFNIQISIQLTCTNKYMVIYGDFNMLKNICFGKDLIY